MNLLDLLVIIIIAICVLYGFYRGFLGSLVKLCSFFFAWFTSLVFYPILSKILSGSPGLFDSIIYYSDGSQKIADLQSATLTVNRLTQPEITQIVGTAGLPTHISAKLSSNMTAKVLDSKLLDGHPVSSVNDYFNITIANIILNLLCFIAVFVIVWLALSIIFNMLGGQKRIPALRKYDALMGGCIGFITGIFMVYLIFSLVPVAMTIVSISSLSKYVDASVFGAFFYKTNFIIGMIPGVI
jgi:hypothetical protein